MNCCCESRYHVPSTNIASRHLLSISIPHFYSCVTFFSPIIYHQLQSPLHQPKRSPLYQTTTFSTPRSLQSTIPSPLQTRSVHIIKQWHSNQPNPAPSSAHSATSSAKTIPSPATHQLYSHTLMTTLCFYDAPSALQLLLCRSMCKWFRSIPCSTRRVLTTTFTVLF